MRKMKAKFDGRCVDCGGALYAGDVIRWERGYGSVHEDEEVCDSYLTQAAEMRMEGYAEAHLMGYGAMAREEGWF